MVAIEPGHWLQAHARDPLDKGALGREVEANWRKFVRMALRIAAILKIDSLPGEKFLGGGEMKLWWRLPKVLSAVLPRYLVRPKIHEDLCSEIGR